MSSPELFYESWLDGLRDDVRALGGTKVVGCMLWPEKDPVAARNKLNDCLNEERRDRLSEEQERLIIRKAKEKRGYSAALYFLCDDTGFTRPAAKDPVDEQTALQRAFIASVKQQEHILSRMEALAQTPVRAVRTA